MTNRADIPRLGASLGVLGTILEHRGQEAFDIMDSWQYGPRKAPSRGEVGGGGGEAGAEDRKLENQQRARAARHFQEHRVDLTQLDELVQRILRRLDIACPPNPEEMKNRRTGDFEPWTPAEVAAAGWCSSCWLASQTFTPIPTDAKGYRRYKDRCGWCGSFLSAHGIDPPKELIVKHQEGRNLSTAEVDEAVKKAKQANRPSKKKRKRQAA